MRSDATQKGAEAEPADDVAPRVGCDALAGLNATRVQVKPPAEAAPFVSTTIAPDQFSKS
jgi:hypothetical protein